tara:strand:+ start:302 stop:427 length:126 start_codon:yes stop_codon:yes gene_type:complete
LLGCGWAVWLQPWIPDEKWSCCRLLQLRLLLQQLRLQQLRM